MYDPEQVGQEIISIDKAINLLGMNFRDFAEAIVQENIFLIILPKDYLSIGIRSKQRLEADLSNPPKSNPYGILPENPDGFIPRLKDNEKLLNTLSLKSCEPYEVVYTDGKYRFGKSANPGELVAYYIQKQDVLKKRLCGDLT
ncbi:hypothetical protein [Halomonas tibetensis]|uniref:Uncharacterized protein n=1 Tax=Halomonas tibetensis TaxID=2259590 RepID=A0ABV7BBV1_9GAMM